MKYFFLVIDYIIPVLMIISYPWWKKIANGDVNNLSGMRTSLSMKNKENWKKANLLCATYYLRVGIVLFLLVTFLRAVPIAPMEWNSCIIVFIGIVSIIAITLFVDQQLQDD